MALSNRLNQIISEQNISKTEFARRLGITVTQTWYYRELCVYPYRQQPAGYGTK